MWVCPLGHGEARGRVLGAARQPLAGLFLDLQDVPLQDALLPLLALLPRNGSIRADAGLGAIVVEANLLKIVKSYRNKPISKTHMVFRKTTNGYRQKRVVGLGKGHSLEIKKL